MRSRFNCELFAHALLDELCLSLPKWLRAAELYRRTPQRNNKKVWVAKIEHLDHIRVGDILLFSDRRIRSIHDPAIFSLHVGVCVDPKLKVVAHSSRYLPTGEHHPDRGQVYQQSVCDILRSPRYNTLVAIRRPIQ